MCFCTVFFFFKQKTAYEMRISDWSSDVCSSDLGPRWPSAPSAPAASAKPAKPPPPRASSTPFRPSRSIEPLRRAAAGHRRARQREQAPSPKSIDRQAAEAESRRLMTLRRRPRSEEHTSELQSLMRISYAVFCLKKKTTTAKTTQEKSN